MRAEVLAATNRLDQAISELEGLLKASPGNVALLNRLGSFYLVADKPRKAIETATQIISKDPDNYRRDAVPRRCVPEHRQARRGDRRFRARHWH